MYLLQSLLVGGGDTRHPSSGNLGKIKCKRNRKYKEVHQIENIHLHQLSGVHGGGSHRRFGRPCIRNGNVNVRNREESKARVLQCDY